MTSGAAETRNDLQIRAAAASDLPRFAEIYRHHVLTGTATFEFEPPSLEEMQRRYAAVLQKGLPWFSACVGSAVIGYAYVTSFRPRPAYAWTVEDSIYLDPTWTRRGAGRALLTALIRECEAIGVRQMIAVIGDSANTPSIALHRSLGFVDAGVQRAVGLKFGRWLDTVTMQRSLGAGESTIPLSPPAPERVGS